ncbi:MAG TPA: hypothetical protein VGP76_13090 [Planctomycetaceae bacterium]|jgi:uncharacterized protein (UPF0332 family)|nr:hypothetical protein [Planctomycetaceae bacterium]
MNGTDFIQVATDWSKSATVGEPTWRSSTSRAYYGAFHIARDFLEVHLGFTGKFRLFKSHQKVYDALGNSGNEHAREAGRKLRQFANRRHMADYELQDAGSGNQKAAEHSILDAEEIKGYIDKVVTDCRDPKILGAMKIRVAQWIAAQ